MVDEIEKEKIKRFIQLAGELAQEIDDPDLQKITYQIILDKLLSQVFTEHATTDSSAAKDQAMLTALTLPELVNRLKPSSLIETTLLIAYDLQLNQKLDSFTVREITEGFERARLPKPKNVSDQLNSLVKKGFLVKISPKGVRPHEYSLTMTGEEHVVNWFKEVTKKS